MWIAIVGEIWKQRNNINFNNSRPDPIEIFTMAQLTSLELPEIKRGSPLSILIGV